MVDDALIALLACPVTGRPLRRSGDRLVTDDGRAYPVVDGVPVLLAETFGDSGNGAADHTFAVLRGEADFDRGDPDPGRERRPGGIDPFVQRHVAAAGGNLYRALVGRLEHYPIPRFPFRPAGGETLLEVGCNWGRWVIAAARAGFAPIGLDPSINAVMAARRVARSLGADAHFVVGEGRHLPFRDGALDAAFSFSVLQHLARDDARRAIAEMGRVLGPGGRAVVQMPNRWSVLGIYHQLRRGFAEGNGFDVRYWSTSELADAFGTVGATDIRVDAFFSLNAQPADLELLSPLGRAVVRVSEAAKAASRRLPPLALVADSLLCEAVKPGPAGTRGDRC